MAAAFGLNDEGHERLRAEVNRQYGVENKLIIDQKPKGKSHKRRQRSRR